MGRSANNKLENILMVETTNILLGSSSIVPITSVLKITSRNLKDHTGKILRKNIDTKILYRKKSYTSFYL